MLMILDLDELIVDYGPSSRQAAALAAGTYVEEICCVERGRHLFKVEHVDRIRRLGGFSDDRDVTYALIYIVLNSLPSPFRPKFRKVKSASEVRNAFRNQQISFSVLIGHCEREWHDILEQIDDLGGGIEGLHRKFKDSLVEEFILYRGEVQACHTLSEEDIEDSVLSEHPAENMVVRLFDEFYLGDESFESLYGLAPLKPRGAGLRQLEVNLQDPEVLLSLAEAFEVMIWARQPVSEVQSTLSRLGLGALESRCVYQADMEHQLGLKREQIMLALQDVIMHSFERVGQRFKGKEIYLVSTRPCFLEAGRLLKIKSVGFCQRREEHRMFKEACGGPVIRRLQTLLNSVGSSK